MQNNSRKNQSDVLSRLQTWYLASCDGAWEHRYGIRIQTLDNPGWLVKIVLPPTKLKRLPFAKIEEGLGEGGHPIQSRWLHCAVEDGVWQGSADGTQLNRLLQLFLDWSDGTI